jgi:hypothetical protein
MAVEMLVVKPPAVIVQFVENVQVAEFTFVLHPEPASTGLEPLSPDTVSVPLIVIVWSGMAGQFVPPGSGEMCWVYVPEVIVQGPPPVPGAPSPDVEPPQARSTTATEQATM